MRSSSGLHFIGLDHIRAYSSLIAYYDTSFRLGGAGLSWALSKIGEYSYSIYLLHTFFVFQVAEFVQRHMMDISNFYVALAWSFACFTLMIPIGVISFTYVDAPFLRLRRVYTKPNAQASLSTRAVSLRRDQTWSC
ncbi:peptidoglycan/LPS O-acetylase OafA/YrhL [Bradyrhizobium sp. USDA 3650]